MNSQINLASTPFYPASAKLPKRLGRSYFKQAKRSFQPYQTQNPLNDIFNAVSQNLQETDQYEIQSGGPNSVDEFIKNGYSDPEMEDLEYISNSSLREFLRSINPQKQSKKHQRAEEEQKIQESFHFQHTSKFFMKLSKQIERLGETNKGRATKRNLSQH